MAKLNVDPTYLAARRREEEERERQMATLRLAESPLIDELRAAGFVVNSVWDLVNSAAPYPAALPILLKHVQHSYPGAVREGIARSLAVGAARFGWEVLTRLYRVESEERVKDALAVAISVIADQELAEQVAALVRDAQLGPSRVLLLAALDRLDAPGAFAALHELRGDPELAAEIGAILRRRSKAGIERPPPPAG